MFRSHQGKGIVDTKSMGEFAYIRDGILKNNKKKVIIKVSEWLCSTCAKRPLRDLRVFICKVWLICYILTRSDLTWQAIDAVLVWQIQSTSDCIMLSHLARSFENLNSTNKSDSCTSDVQQCCYSARPRFQT